MHEVVYCCDRIPWDYMRKRPDSTQAEFEIVFNRLQKILLDGKTPGQTTGLIHYHIPTIHIPTIHILTITSLTSHPHYSHPNQHILTIHILTNTSSPTHPHHHILTITSPLFTPSLYKSWSGTSVSNASLHCYTMLVSLPRQWCMLQIATTIVILKAWNKDE